MKEAHALLDQPARVIPLMATPARDAFTWAVSTLNPNPSANGPVVVLLGRNHGAGDDLPAPAFASPGADVTVCS